MVEFTNADNTGGYLVPDDAASIFAPHFAAEGFFPVELSDPLVRFNVPFATGEPPVEIKAADIISLFSKMRGRRPRRTGCCGLPTKGSGG